MSAVLRHHSAGRHGARNVFRGSRRLAARCVMLGWPLAASRHARGSRPIVGAARKCQHNSAGLSSSVMKLRMSCHLSSSARHQMYVDISYICEAIWRPGHLCLIADRRSPCRALHHESDHSSSAVSMKLKFRRHRNPAFACVRVVSHNRSAY